MIRLPLSTTRASTTTAPDARRSSSADRCKQSRAPGALAKLLAMAEYRVGVAVLRLAEPQLAWIEANGAELKPMRVLGASDGLLRLVLTFEARTEGDAVEQAMAVFERAADRLTAEGIFVTDPGMLAVEAWKESDTPPEPYQDGPTKLP
jgi:hypothetical protein